MNNSTLPSSDQIRRIQRWSLQGIAPMHRALIRRIASEHLVGSQKIQWSVFESDAPLVPASEFGCDIHWFSVDVLRACCESTDSLGTGSQYTGSQYTGSQYTGSQYTGSQYTGSQYTGSQCIGGKISSRGGVSEAPLRLLWCWPPENYHDFHSAVPWMASGVVYNLLTLRGWVERALLQGHWSEHGASQSNPNFETNALVNPRYFA
jgi:hypothetical protein